MKIKHHPNLQLSGASRRRLLQHLLLSSGLASSASVIPHRWYRPVIRSVMLPAHAAASITQISESLNFECVDIEEAFIVPTGINSIDVVLQAAGGGSGGGGGGSGSGAIGGAGGAGAAGEQRQLTLLVKTGDELRISTGCPGTAGQGGMQSTNTRTGGAGGFPDGQSGSDTTPPHGAGGSGGGAGGSSWIIHDGQLAGIALGGAGGGGGGFASAAAGPASADPGADGSNGGSGGSNQGGAGSGDGGNGGPGSMIKSGQAAGGPGGTGAVGTLVFGSNGNNGAPGSITLNWTRIAT